MPNYFRPRLKSNPELGIREQFLAIDEKLCELLQVSVNPKFFVLEWVDTIGLGFAVGRTREMIIASFADHPRADDYAKIVNWLLENCEIDCYYSVK